MRSERVFNYTSVFGAKSTNVPATEKDGFHRDNVSMRLGFDDDKKGVDFLAHIHLKPFILIIVQSTKENLMTIPVHAKPAIN